MQPGLVSVMMPAYNAAGYIGDAIASVLEQTYADLELLVVNDGSSDGSADVVRRFTDPRVRLIEQANGGEATARNTALDNAHGEFLGYLDADDQFLADHLARTVDFLRANPGCDAVYTDGFHIDARGTRLPTLQSRRRGPFSGRLHEELVRASDVFGPPICVVLRREGITARGLRYDPRIVIGPDWEFFTRYAESATFGYIQAQTVLYRIHQTNVTSVVDFDRRSASLSLCREKAIASSHFDACSPETRAAVFYDLLVDLLRGQPMRRSAALDGVPFSRLPADARARLLRLTAVDALVHGEDVELASAWLRRARAANLSDWRAAILGGALKVSPSVTRALLRAASPLRGAGRPVDPFADLSAARDAALASGASSPRHT